jgi:hypothetical protein
LLTPKDCVTRAPTGFMQKGEGGLAFIMHAAPDLQQRGI